MQRVQSPVQRVSAWPIKAESSPIRFTRYRRCIDAVPNAFGLNKFELIAFELIAFGLIAFGPTATVPIGVG